MKKQTSFLIGFIIALIIIMSTMIMLSSCSYNYDDSPLYSYVVKYDDGQIDEIYSEVYCDATIGDTLIIYSSLCTYIKDDEIYSDFHKEVFGVYRNYMPKDFSIYGDQLVYSIKYSKVIMQ